MRDKRFILGAYNTTTTSLGIVSYRRYKTQQSECVFFGKYFGWSSQDDTRRPTQLINGYFCANPNTPLPEQEVLEVIHGLSLSRETQKPVTNPVVAKTNPSTPVTKNDVADSTIANIKFNKTVDYSKPSQPTNKVTQSANSIDAATRSILSQTRSVQGTWQGVSDDVSGTFTSDSSLGKGRLRLSISSDSSVNTICSGQWLWAKGAYDTALLPQGTWSLACNDGKTAGGTYISHAPGEGAIEGVDARGGKLTFSYSALQEKLNSAPGGSIEERLAKLKSLLDDGLLTEEEAEEKRRELLKGL